MPSRILIGCTGSVASIKIPVLIEALRMCDQEVDIRVIATDHALHFFSQQDLPVKVYTNQDEWDTWSSVQDPVLHIELRKWADILLIAPLDANTMAKMACGICDNLLTCVIRAWDLQKPLLFAPAMNTHMWNHPITSHQIEVLKNFGYTEVPCISKKLACGDIGYGGMAEVSTLVSAIKLALESTTDSSASSAVHSAASPASSS